jgi:hypothetical protein
MVARHSEFDMSAGHIPWFNPREMADDTVLKLSTGREGLCAEFIKVVKQRLNHPATGGHWLVTGQRGGGKSYFLRLIQATLAQQDDARVRFVLLPEEHQNIAAPHELLLEIMRMRQVDKGDLGQPSAWRVADRAGEWQSAKAKLLESLNEQLLIVAVENFDELLAQAFTSDEDHSLLRVLLSHEAKILFLVTSVEGSFDENYDARLFKQFEHHELAGWTPAEHRIYLQNRAQLVNKTASPRQLARVEAYSRYTGGNPRVAAVVAGVILDEQEVLLAAADIHATLDKMSDYYRALLQRIPPNSKKILDALIRGGEPCSQSGLAERLGAKQSDIARAVSWLHDFGYIAVQAVKGGKEKPYIMADRLFAQFYRMRYLQPGQQTQLAILAEFLADALEQREKFNFAERYWLRGQEPEARMMLALALQDHHIDAECLPESYRSTEQLMRVVGQILEPSDTSDIIAKCEKLLIEYNTDESFSAAYQQAYEVLKICNRFGSDLSGQSLAELIDCSLLFSPVQSLLLFRHCVAYDCKEEKLRKLLTKFEQQNKNIEELKVANLVQFQEIEHQHEFNKQFPLAASYESLAKYLSGGSSTSNTVLNLEKSLQLYTTALRHRLKNAQLIDAQNVLAAINRIAIQLDEQEQFQFIISALSEILKIAKPALNHCIELISCVDSLAFANFGLNNYAETLELFSEALKLAREQNETTLIAYNLTLIAEIKGAMGQTEEALIDHREALSFSQSLQNEIGIALNIGQIARYTLVNQGLNATWQELAGAKSLQPSDQHSTVEALAEAIDDISQQQGLPAAFAVANQLLAELPAHFAAPYEPFIRALWIKIVALQIDKKLLRDLTAELIPIYGATMQPLAELLKQWLDYLDMPTEQRDDYLSRLNPDLAATLKALGEFE